MQWCLVLGYSNMKTGESRSFLGLPTVSAGKVAFLCIECKTANQVI